MQAGVVIFNYDNTGNQVSQQTASPAAPVVLGSPPNQVVATGGIGGFSVNVSSPQAVTYQWYFNGTAISGATGDSLLLTNITTANEGSYTVRVTNGSGSVTSSVYKLGVDGNGNGLPDSWEMASFGNLNQTAGGDYDGDGISNLDEYLNGTDPTVREIYYWNVASGDFTVPTNWFRYNTPGVPPRAPGAGDTAVINTGTFTIPANTTIAVSQVTVNAPFTAPTDTDLTLNITGNWTFNSSFSLANGHQFAVSGNGGSVTVAGTTNLNGAYLLADYGAQLILPNVSNYAVPAGMSVRWVVQHQGSTLSFPNLTNITGSATANTYLDLTSQYDSTATLSLPVLTSISKADDGDPYANSGVRFYANGGLISAPNLSSFNDNDSHPDSSLNAYSGGVLSLPALLAPSGVNIDLNSLSHPERFTSLVGTRSFQVNSGTVVMSNLASINGFSSISADYGAQLSFPGVTAYVVPAGMSVQWRAAHPSTLLSFPNLTTITGPTTPNTYLDLIAQYDNGPTLSLPALTTITKANDNDPYNNSGVRLYADNGTIAAPNLTAFNDNDVYPDSSLNAYNSGVLSLPKLLTPKGVNLDVNAQSHPEQFTSLAKARSLRISGAGTVVMNNLSSVNGLSAITADYGAQVSFPNVTTYAVATGMSVQWRAAHLGTILSFPNLTTVAGPTTPNSYFDLIAQYDNGALLSLPTLTTISKADDGDVYNNSGVRFFADNSTISAPNLVTFNDNDSRPDSSLNASNAGVLALPKLTAPRGVNLDINAPSHPEQFTSLVGARSLRISGTGAVVMSSLTSITGLSYVAADYGVQLSFPTVSSYAVPAGMSVRWEASHSGTLLSFPNLTSITGPTMPNTYFDLVAQYENGPTLSLPVLTTITKADDGDPYTNSGVRLYAYGGMISAPNLSSFQDNDSHPDSSLNASSGGTMLLTNLTSGGIRGVTLNGVTLSTGPVSAPIIKSVVLANGTFRLTVPTVAGRTYQLQQTSALTSTTSWQNVGSAQTGTNALMDFTTSATGNKGFYRVVVTPSP